MKPGWPRALSGSSGIPVTAWLVSSAHRSEWPKQEWNLSFCVADCLRFKAGMEGTKSQPPGKHSPAERQRQTLVRVTSRLRVASSGHPEKRPCQV